MKHWQIVNRVSVLLAAILLAAGCELFSSLTNPLAGTWVYSASTGVYDDYGYYHLLYTEETFILEGGGTMEFTFFIEDRTYGGKRVMTGSGTYTYDDRYFSATVDLSRNDFGILGDYTFSGRYYLDGTSLTIYFDGQAVGSTYYRQ